MEHIKHIHFQAFLCSRIEEVVKQEQHPSKAFA
jgi:hypothetical protein